MNKAVIVTGSVGAGKTIIAKKIANLLKFEYFDVKRLFDKYPNVVCGFDKKNTKEIRVEKLNNVLIKKIKDSKKGIVIDSHLSHYLPKKYVDVCVICECSDLKRLKKRLEKRKYSKLKIKENLEAEILEVCLVEALEAGHNVIVVDTAKKIDYKKLKKDLLKAIKG